MPPWILRPEQWRRSWQWLRWEDFMQSILDTDRGRAQYWTPKRPIRHASEISPRQVLKCIWSSRIRSEQEVWIWKSLVYLWNYYSQNGWNHQWNKCRQRRLEAQALGPRVSQLLESGRYSGIKKQSRIGKERLKREGKPRVQVRQCFKNEECAFAEGYKQSKMKPKVSSNGNIDIILDVDSRGVSGFLEMKNWLEWNQGRSVGRRSLKYRQFFEWLLLKRWI